MNWIRYTDEKPPTNKNILVLVNGEIHEGYLDSRILMGEDEPTLMQTLYTNSTNYGCGSAQHTSWGIDPYWMHIPYEKPKQILGHKYLFECKKEK
jgi:hypothetical protein